MVLPRLVQRVSVVHGRRIVTTGVELELAGSLRAIAEGRLLPSLDLLGSLQSRLSVLEAENLDLRRELAFSRPKKRRSPAEWSFRVRSWEWVEMKAFPKAFPEGKMVRALRVHVPLEDARQAVPYWDITRQKEIAMLEPILPLIAGTDRYVRFRQEGDGPTARFSMSVDPA